MSNSFLSFNKSQDEEDFHCTTFLNDLMDRGHHKFSETSGFATYDESYMQYNSNHHDIQNFPNQFLSSPEPINHQITRLNQQFQTKILKPASKKINKKVFVSKTSQIKKRLINQIKKLKKRELNFSFITFNLIRGQGTTRSKAKKNPTSKGHHKNLPKILGNAIISYSINKSYSQNIEKIINQESKFLENEYPEELKNKKFSQKDLIEWIKTEKLKANFVRLQSFRDIWGFRDEFGEKSLKHRLFCCVLKEISKYYMENEFIMNIFQKINVGTMQKENARCYLEKLPVFLRGVNNPEHLLNIEETF